MKVLAVAVAAIFVAGCVSAEKRMEIDSAFNETIPECYSEKECEYKWSAARKWVIENAGMKLQHVEDDFLETYNPPRNSVKLAARVMKEPIADGYQIKISTWCANMFGCSPDAAVAAQDFNNTVNAVALPDF